QFCAIGSVKSNIGHCESAAGIAGVTKVLLQIKHGQLVPSLHSKVLNPNIDFSNSPFRVQQKLAEWKRPVIQMNGETKEYPRIAGISSFGAGGANLHLIIEEAPYIEPLDENNREYIIPISACSAEQLQKYAKNIAKKLEHSNYSLRDVAYTLQVGRRAMQHRLAIVARSIKELIEVLVNYAEFAKINSDKSVFYANSRELKKAKTIFSDEDVCQLIKQWINQKRMDKIALAWTQGFIKDFTI
ncbi:MAG: ketoacyl-synthetase C-terminal extension domain-containing protein, partial [Exilibacterium sp.]